jgi:hypothetical protein
MRSLGLLVVAHVLALASSPLSAQQAGVEEAPPGTNWIADRSSRHYFPLSCGAVHAVARPDRLYYATESAVRQAGYTLSPDCVSIGAPRLEDAPAVSPAAAVAVSQVPAAKPRNDHARRGFWFSGGLGYGSLGCDGCDDRVGGLSGGIQLGGSVSQKVLLGGGTAGFTRSEGGVTETVATAVALIRFYPSATGGFFLLGGLGFGAIEVDVSGFGSASETGAGALLGLGYDIRVGEKVSLTPFWNGFAASTTNADANVGQLGLSVTLH